MSVLKLTAVGEFPSDKLANPSCQGLIVLVITWTGFGKLKPVSQIQPQICFHKVLLEKSQQHLLMCCL